MFYCLYRISCMVFHEKIFLLLHSINYPNFIVWLHLLLEISDKICIVIICYSVGDFINFEIYLSFLMNTKSFLHDHKIRTKICYSSRAKIAFKVKQKAFFIILKGLSFAKNCLRPESAPLMMLRCSTLQDFQRLFSHYSTFCMKELQAITLLPACYQHTPRW